MASMCLRHYFIVTMGQPWWAGPIDTMYIVFFVIQVVVRLLAQPWRAGQRAFVPVSKRYVVAPCVVARRAVSRLVASALSAAACAGAYRGFALYLFYHFFHSVKHKPGIRAFGQFARVKQSRAGLLRARSAHDDIMPNQARMHQHWMRIAECYSLLSKDPSTKVGAVIVSPDGRKLSGGYNGFARGMPESQELWQRPEKYDRVIHAELNALLNCPFDTMGCACYCTHQPCHICIQHLINAGIQALYYREDYQNARREDIWLQACNHMPIVEKVS